MGEGGRVLTSGPREHSCHPGMERHWCDGTGREDPPAGWYLVDLHCEAGTVWECDCGLVWVAEGWPEWKDVNILMGRITWRPEKRRERRRRLRDGYRAEPAADPKSGLPLKGVR